MSRLAILAILMLVTQLVAPATAQDHFVGDDQSVNRVIQLQSSSSKPVGRVAQTTTSRSLQERTTTPRAKAPSIQYDEIGVPKALQQPLKPTVERTTTQTRPQTTAQTQSPTVRTQTPTIRTQAPTVNKNWARPASTTLPKKQPTATAKTTAAKNLQAVNRASTISTKMEAPKYINVNQPAMFKLNVKNESKTDSANVVVVARIPKHAKLATATPQPNRVNEQTYEFSLPRMGVSENRQIAMELVPTKKLSMEIGTQVLVENVHSTLVAVRQPALSIIVSGPQQVNIGQKSTHTVTVTNVGDGHATDVRLDTIFPESMQVTKQSAGPMIKKIEAGKSVKYTFETMAMQPGKTTLVAKTEGQGIENKESKLDINILQPELRISAIGPKLNFVQRDGIYSIGIQNTGEVDVTDVSVSLSVPSGMKVNTINRQAKVDAQRGTLTWKFDRIEATTQEQIQLKATAIEEGSQICNILVTSNETREKQIQLTTMVTTRADISVRIKNVTGPVQVGGKAEFLVEVENRGSRQANDVAVRVELPESLSPVKNQEDFVEQDGNSLIFAEPQVPPGQKVTFKFQTMGVNSGEHVVRSIVQTSASERRLISEDTVFVYEVDEARVSESVSPNIPRR